MSTEITPDSPEDTEEVSARLLIEEKRLIVLKWTQTLGTLREVRETSPQHQTYIDLWIKDYEIGICRLLDELVELGHKA